MKESQPTSSKPLAGYLVGVQREGMTAREALDHLRELELLATSYGVPVMGRELAVLREPHAAFLLGAGKTREIHQASMTLGADVIIVDDDLSPSQQRNWERLTGLAVIDRREVILGIFADRARTREARLQVDLARAQYSLPRLARAWTHLERQRGGGGFRGGGGEAQIEVDRRLVRRQIDRLRRELERVRRARATQRKARASVPVPVAAIVGYTNAGKSSLLNALTGAGAVEEDKLFATLDPATRKLILPNRQTLLLSDTVGFIRKLPHTLIDAFKATLEEAQLADMLIHVLDASHPDALEQRAATEAVLDELGALGKPMALVLNKIDLLGAGERMRLGILGEGYRHVAALSTRTREGVGGLIAMLAGLSGHDLMRVRLRVPPSRHDIVSLVHREGDVESESFDGADTMLEAVVPRRLRGRFAEFMET
ncbi:MAG: GTPase HflX [Candidatus Sumerlaeota bacterium]|nr:GTPase HflX [Candidatus Sumerlaeota bacterium]